VHLVATLDATGVLQSLGAVLDAPADSWLRPLEAILAECQCLHEIGGKESVVYCGNCSGDSGTV
jgi:hypothetical protein